MQQALAQADRLVREQGGLHGRGWAVDDRSERHVREEVAFEVESGCDFDQFQSVGVQSKHRPLGDVQDRLAAPNRFAAGEGPMFDLGDELATAIIGQEGADEHQPTGILADVDEATGAG